MKICVRCEPHSLWSPDTGSLVVAMARMDAAPVIDDDVGAEGANDANHVFQDLIAPNLLGLLGSLGVTKIAGPGEIKFYAIASCGGEKFLSADESELWRLFGSESILATFPPGDGQKRYVSVKSPSEVSKDGRRFIIRVSSDVKNACGHTRAIDGFDGFGQPKTRAGSRRELCVAVWHTEASKNDGR